MVLLRTLIEVTLDDAEVLLVVDGLHNEPRERLMVFRVDGGGFLELGFKLLDAFRVGFGAEVYMSFLPCVSDDVLYWEKKKNVHGMTYGRRLCKPFWWILSIDFQVAMGITF